MYSLVKRDMREEGEKGDANGNEGRLMGEEGGGSVGENIWVWLIFCVLNSLVH